MQRSPSPSRHGLKKKLVSTPHALLTRRRIASLTRRRCCIASLAATAGHPPARSGRRRLPSARPLVSDIAGCRPPACSGRCRLPSALPFPDGPCSHVGRPARPHARPDPGLPPSYPGRTSSFHVLRVAGAAVLADGVGIGSEFGIGF
jgi:hypothetical protein